MHIRFASGVVVLFFLIGTAHAHEISRLIGDGMTFIHEEHYGISIEERIAWNVRENGFRGSAGSVSSDRFAFDLDVKLRTDFLDCLTFAYRHHRRESYLRDDLSHLADLTTGFGPWRIGITGMVESRKENNSIGILTGIDGGPVGKLTLRGLWPRVYYNSKGPDDEQYRKRPFVWQLEGLFTDSPHAAFLSIEYRPEWVLERTDTTEKQQSWTIDGFYSWTSGKNRTAIQIEAIGLEHSVESGSTQPDLESFDHLKLTLEYARSVGSVEWVYRVSRIDIEGESDDPVQDEGDPLGCLLFNFVRDEWMMNLQGSTPVWESGKMSLGVIGSVQDIDTGESRFYSDVSGRSRVKVYGHYRHRFGERGSLEGGLSYNASETRFGGGYLAITVWM